tara:strand:+ start:229 stop:423 length:195 start_codon:yes stop_codon:yes gene_type:complete
MTEKEAVNFLIESALEKYTVELRECNKIGNDKKSKEIKNSIMEHLHRMDKSIKIARSAFSKLDG